MTQAATAELTAEQIWQNLEAEEAGKPAPNIQAAAPEETPQATQSAEPPPAAPATGSESADDAPTMQQVLDRLSGLETQNSELRAQSAQLTTRLRNAEGHIGGLKGQLQQTQQAASQATAQGHQAPTAQELRTANGNPEAMAKLKQDYPEFADAMTAVLDEQARSVEERVRQHLATAQQQTPGVTPEQLQQTEARIRNELRAELQVEQRHAGWKQTINTPEFGGWLTRQPREVQMLASSPSPQDAIRLLDLHVESKKPKTPTPNPNAKRLETAAAIPDGRPAANTRGKPIDEMTGPEYWAYLDEQDRLQAQGR